MLPPFIIEQIRKREEEEERAQQQEQPRLELPLVPPGTRRRLVPDDEAEVERGVVVIDLGR